MAVSLFCLSANGKVSDRNITGRFTNHHVGHAPATVTDFLKLWGAK